MFLALHPGYRLVIAEYRRTENAYGIVDSDVADHPRCRPEEAEFVLALWRQAGVTPNVSETVNCSLDEAKCNLRWSTVKRQESQIPRNLP
jgi:hypothetical protein